MIKDVLKEALEEVKLSSSEKEGINKITKAVVDEIKKRVSRKSIKTDVFIGGSLAKETIIKSDNYDVDIFLRFDKKYTEEEMKKHFKRIFFLFRIKGYKIKINKIHGSRDYIRISFKDKKDINNKTLEVEVIPVFKVSKPEEARNVTDLSYFHVNYIRSKLKSNKKLVDEIALAKAFFQANGIYGAETYIRGFSGYAVELLTIYYKSFEKFLEGISEEKEKIIIDQEKMYKDKNELLEKINKSKKEGPLILIDPTYRERNAGISVSDETFQKFKLVAEKFLKNPSIEFFHAKKIDEISVKKKALEHDAIFVKIMVKTNKQPGDIAGTKLLKFSKMISKEIESYFNVLDRRFEYHQGKHADVYFILKRKKERVMEGPSLQFKEAVDNFKKTHKIWYEKNGKVYSSKPTDISVKDFLRDFNQKTRKSIKEMGITSISIIDVQGN